jgi:hypothetical protein
MKELRKQKDEFIRKLEKEKDDLREELESKINHMDLRIKS